MGKFKDWVIDWLLSMVGAFDFNVNQAVRVLTEDIFNTNNSMFGMALSVSNIIKPIALIIISILFLIEFLKITINMDILKWEFGLRVFFKLILAKAAVDIAFPLMSAIYATGAEWILKTGITNGSMSMAISSALTPMIINLTWSEALGLVCTMLIPFIIIWFVGLTIIVIAYARTFEIMIYLAVSPLPCAFLPCENSRITKKFFLSFAGVCLQGLFIILSIKLYQCICETTLIAAIQSSTRVSDIAFNMLIGALVLITAVFKSGSWAKSLMDAA